MANEVALKKALEDEAFVKELLAMENPEDVQAALNAKGADITVEEVKDIAKALSAQDEGELDENALEDVAGGSALGTIKDILNVTVAGYSALTDPVGYLIGSTVGSRW